mgnify:CR=1 FL=1
MVNYKNSRIYKLIGGDNILISGTTISLGRRLANLHRDFKLGLGANDMREVMKYYHADIILIENFPCDSREKLNDRVKYWITQTPCINRPKIYIN